MSKEIQFEESSGNVFQDLNLPDADELYSKTRKYVYTLKSNNSVNTLARWRGFLTSPM